MLLFGVTGPIGHGKTTFANALMTLAHPAMHIESSMLVSSVANEWFATFRKQLLVDPIDYDLLNEWLGELAEVVSHQLRKVSPAQLHITHNQVLDESKYYYKLFMHLNLIRQGVIALGEPITEENKERHRTILQWLGGFLVHRVSPGVWYDEIERRIKQAREDGIQLCIVGGVRYPYDADVIRRNNGLIVKLIRADLPERELADITEEHRHEIKPDVTVISDSRPEALVELARAMHHDILANDVLSEYHSDDFEPLA